MSDAERAEMDEMAEAIGTLTKQLAVAIAAIQELIAYVAAKEGISR